MRLDRVLQRAAVDLDRVGHAGGRERPGEDERAHHEVVGERDVRPRPRDDLRDGRDVALHVRGDLRLVEILERTRLDAVVAVGHVDRQQPADVRPVDRRPRRVAPDRQLELAAVPVAGRVDPRQVQRRAVLAEQMQLVARPHERLAELRVVDVGPRAAQQVAVEDQDAHWPVTSPKAGARDERTPGRRNRRSGRRC